jgi:hypothetical protein
MATPRKARAIIPCEECGTACEQRNTRRRFCNAKCRAAAWQRKREDRESRLREGIKVLAKEAGLRAEDFA